MNMKTIKKHLTGLSFIACLFAVATVLTSCFNDDSTSWERQVSGITISGIESSYTKTAFVGEVLSIHPTVETEFAESDLEYQWIMINAKTGTVTEKGDTIQPMILGNEKNLDATVSVAPGQYQVRLNVKSKSTGYSALAYATLNVQTSFSQGFYILKETADGNTEIDQITNEDILSANLLEQVTGSSMKGKPVNMCVGYSIDYINPDNDELDNEHGLFISSDQKNFAIYRLTDLKTIFDRSNLLYEEMPDDMMPSGIYTADMSVQMLANNGLYMYYPGGTGQFGIPDYEGHVSEYYYYDFSSWGGGEYWDPVTHSLMGFDYLMNASPLLDKTMGGEELTQNLMTYDCLHCGLNYVTNTAVGHFVLRDNATQNRYLYLTSGGYRGQFLTSRTQLKAGSHMAKADHYATNGISASYIYCTEGGKLYACVTNSDDLNEVELKPEGIPAGETINYVANQFWNNVMNPASCFDYLIVGTQSGNTYKLYFYELNGGAPVGQPIKKVEGEGKVKKVRYINPNIDVTFQSYFYIFNAND